MFENIQDVVSFLVTHCPTGFQTQEERDSALAVIEAANPLTAERKAAEAARIKTERERDTGMRETPVNAAQTPNDNAEFRAAVAAEVAKALANLQLPTSIPGA